MDHHGAAHAVRFQERAQRHDSRPAQAVEGEVQQGRADRARGPLALAPGGRLLESLGHKVAPPLHPGIAKVRLGHGGADRQWPLASTKSAEAQPGELLLRALRSGRRPGGAAVPGQLLLALRRRRRLAARPLRLRLRRRLRLPRAPGTAGGRGLRRAAVERQRLPAVGAAQVAVAARRRRGRERLLQALGRRAVAARLAPGGPRGRLPERHPCFL